MYNYTLMAQSEYKPKERYDQYRFKLECPMYRCDINGKVLDSTVLVAGINSRFILIFTEKDMAIIRFVINSKRNQKRNIDFTGLDNSTYRYYLIRKPHLDYKTEPYDFRHWNLTVGNVVTPIKLRISPFIFNKDVSIGPTFGVKYEKNQYSIGAINFLVGAGITSVTLDSFNTGGYLSKSQESLAFTPSLGIMYMVRSSQFGVFSGFDILSASSDYTPSFIYRKSPWFSIGFGYSLFSTK